MQRREDDRKTKRITCELHVGERRYSAIALDFSKTGLFLQTGATASLEDPVRLVLRLPDANEPLELLGIIKRKKTVPRRLVSVATGGLGIQLEEPPKEFLRFVASLRSRPGQTRKPARKRPAQSEPEPEPRQAFRVRLKQRTSPRTRNVLVTAKNEADAKAEVIAELGDEWLILDVSSD